MATGAADETPGTGIPPGAAPEQRPEVAGGIHTFLIADIRGYTAYTEEHGDEAAARLASQFAESVEEVIAGYDGDLLELRGDEALVVFDSSRQALRAAVALQSAFRDPDGNSLAVPIGIGLDVGEAVSVRGGYRGAALNMAARLCALAGPGEVFATSEVVHLATRVEGIRFRPHANVSLKGLPRPVAVVMVEAEGVQAPNSPALRPADRRLPGRGSSAISNRGTWRRRIVVAAVSGSLLLVTALIWGPWLPPAERTTSANVAKPAPEPLRAVLLFGDQFAPPGNGIGHFYMFPAGGTQPGDYPPVGIRSAPVLRDWEQHHGAVPVIFQTVRLELEGLTNEPVLITRVQPRVVSRKPPLRGWYVVPEAGSGSTVRYVEVNLGCADPKAVVVGGNKPARRQPISALDLQVSRKDKEQLEITAYSPRAYVRWAVDITYVADGRVRTLRVDDPRLHVTAASPGIRAYVAPLKTGALVRRPDIDPTQADVRDSIKRFAYLCTA